MIMFVIKYQEIIN